MVLLAPPVHVLIKAPPTYILMSEPTTSTLPIVLPSPCCQKLAAPLDHQVQGQIDGFVLEAGTVAQLNPSAANDV